MLLPVSILLLIARTTLLRIVWPSAWARSRYAIRANLLIIWSANSIATAISTAWATCSTHPTTRVWLRPLALLRIRATAVAAALPTTIWISSTLVSTLWISVWPSWTSGFCVVMAWPRCYWSMRVAHRLPWPDLWMWLALVLNWWQTSMWLRMLNLLPLCRFFSLPLLLTFFLSLEFMWWFVLGQATFANIEIYTINLRKNR